MIKRLLYGGVSGDGDIQILHTRQSLHIRMFKWLCEHCPDWFCSPNVIYNHKKKALEIHIVWLDNITYSHTYFEIKESDSDGITNIDELIERIGNEFLLRAIEK